jgi:pimeloyl-ACP methyl ester carboxylesterase
MHRGTIRQMVRVLAAAAVVLGILAWNAPAAERSSAIDRCVHAGPHTKIVSFRSPGRHRTKAAILGVGHVGVVFSNQSGNNLCAWLPLARSLAARGVRTLVYDYRWGTQSQEAIAAAAGLRARGVTRVALTGASLGGGASLVAASKRPRGVVGVVSLSGESFITGVRKAIGRLTLPAFFVAAQDDDYGAGTDAQDFYAHAPSKDKRLLIVPGKAHGTDLLADPGLRGTVADWLVAHLRP